MTRTKRKAIHHPNFQQTTTVQHTMRSTIKKYANAFKSKIYTDQQIMRQGLTHIIAF